MNWERCSHCGERREMNVVEGSEVKMPKTGRIRYQVRCAECWEVSLRSRHPNPVETPGLIPERPIIGGKR